MSECKKTCGNCAGRIKSILSKDRCDMTRNTIENYSNTCNHWEPNRETEIVMQKYELKSLRQERDELQAQVAEYEQLNMMQLEAGARAAKLYNEKHGTDIGQLDLARGMVFLMEQNDELQAQVKEREREIEQIEVKCCACHAGHIAQVAVLRGALRWYEDSVSDCPKCGGSGLIDDNQLWTCSECNGSGSAGHKAKKALSATPAEAAERVNALVMALEKLSRLGGPGGGYGNSDGNVIAQKALADWRRK